MYRHHLVGVAIVCMVCWLALGIGLVEVSAFVPRLSGGELAALVLVCAASPASMSATRWLRSSRRLRAKVPAAVLGRRLHGSCVVVGHGEGRALRPIGTPGVAVMNRTASILSRLVEYPEVRVFHGVGVADPSHPPVAHVVAAGRDVLLVETVAWPDGRYSTDPDGQVRCDGVLIGQSVAPLLNAVRHFRRELPRHRVSALVVMYPVGDGRPLPPRGQRDLRWVHAEAASDAVRAWLPRHPRTSTAALVTLVAATTYSPR
jgi:hypothetical protein